MKYILAADDEPVNRDIIEETLADDYEVVCVEDGQACLKSIEQRLPDLLLLDFAMPGMDGVAVCKQLRANDKSNELPIIILSGFASSGRIDEAMEAGATMYITKPFSPEELLSAVESVANKD